MSRGMWEKKTYSHCFPGRQPGKTTIHPRRTKKNVQTSVRKMQPEKEPGKSKIKQHLPPTPDSLVGRRGGRSPANRPPPGTVAPTPAKGGMSLLSVTNNSSKGDSSPLKKQNFLKRRRETSARLHTHPYRHRRKPH